MLKLDDLAYSYLAPGVVVARMIWPNASVFRCDKRGYAISWRSSRVRLRNWEWMDKLTAQAVLLAIMQGEVPDAPE